VIVDVIGSARPNFMKIAPLFWVPRADRGPIEFRFVHAGQHYDSLMSDVFVRQLGLPKPVRQLGVGSGSHASQTARAMTSFESHCLADRPDLVVVVGDVNSTLGCALAASKLGIPVAHLEAGLRSGDRSMPEELNRVATDALSDWFLTPSHDADDNLIREGVSSSRIFRVGNMMIDSLVSMWPAISAITLGSITSFPAKRYGIATFHRPSNVDDAARLRLLVEKIVDVSEAIPLVLVLHPRTLTRLEALDLRSILDSTPRIQVLEAQGYLEFMALLSNSLLAITDSGGVQEETTFLGIPCLTLRANTERPLTVWQGTNQLVEVENLGSRVLETLKAEKLPPPIIEGWDGRSSYRVISAIESVHLRFPKVPAS